MAQDENFREYWVGLPVGVRVHRDGRVTWTIDHGEASGAVRDEWGEADEDTNPTVAAYTEEQVLLDCAVLDATERTPEADTMPTLEMRCPVKYSCGFRTRNLGDMAEHILHGAHE